MGIGSSAPPSASAPTQPLGYGPPAAPPPHEEPPPSRELWPWLVVILILVLAGTAAAVFAAKPSGHHGSAVQATTVEQTVTAPVAANKPAKPGAGMVAVPSLTGLKTADALAALARAGLQGNVKSVFSTDPTGTVATQHPPAGTRVRKGAAVTLDVSRGSRQVSVPDVTGQRKDDAVKTLQVLGLRPDVVKVPSADPKDTVVAQHPDGGTKVAKGAGVLLNVSSGKSPAAPKAKPGKPPTPAKPRRPAAVSVTVPDVTGESLAAAQAQIRGTGLVTEIRRVPSSRPKDTVVAQSPQGGSSARRGDHVLVNVSLGPSKRPPTATYATVPDVTGENQATATADLRNAGLTVAAVHENTGDSTQDGVVIDQTPTGGTKAAANSRVTIYVGRYTGG